MPIYGMTEAQVRGYFSTQTGLSREAQNLPPLSSEQIRELWAAMTPAERVVWEGKALAALTDRLESALRPKSRADYPQAPDASKRPRLKRDDSDR